MAEQRFRRALEIDHHRGKRADAHGYAPRRSFVDAPPRAPAPAFRPLVELRGVGKRYGGLEVFRDIDLMLDDAETVALIGPAGSGVSMLLRCIDGLAPISAGEIRIAGARVTEPPPGVGVVFQNAGLFPWKTVFENIAYGLKCAGLGAAARRDRVERAIAEVGLAGFEASYPEHLPADLQQRCGLARALAIEPRLLLLDEPFGALEAEARAQLQIDLLALWDKRPTAMLFVTHSIDEALLMGDRILVLNGRPSTIHAVIETGLPRSRDHGILASPRGAELREQVARALEPGPRRAAV